MSRLKMTFLFSFVYLSLTLTLAQKKIEHNFQIFGKMKGNNYILTGVKQKSGVKQIRLIPGDNVTVELVRCKPIVLGKWAYHYEWRSERQRGKKKIITIKRQKRVDSLLGTLGHNIELYAQISKGERHKFSLRRKRHSFSMIARPCIVRFKGIAKASCPPRQHRPPGKLKRGPICEYRYSENQIWFRVKLKISR